MEASSSSPSPPSSLPTSKHPIPPTDPKDKALFDQVAAYAASTSQEELSMQSAQLNRRARELAHEYADYFNLYHKSFGKGKDRYVVIRHEPSRLKVGRYEQDAWVEYAYNPEVEQNKLHPSQLRVVSSNVLFDLHDKSKTYDFNDLIHCEARWPLLLKMLEELDPDILALQEVTLAFNNLLREQEWVRKNYFVSDLTGESLDPGNMLLSKYPISKVYFHEYKSSFKSMILAKIPLRGRELSVAIVHLKAGPASAFGFIRGQQIRETIQTQEFLKCDDAIIMGDFNMRDVDNEKSEPLEKAGYVDLWAKLHPEDPGYTYDISRNTLAQAISARICQHENRAGSSNRFDRIMLKSTIWKEKSIELVGTEPVLTLPTGEKIFPSDHFGLLAVLDL